MFGIVSSLIKYVFITVIYLFIFGVMRLIYLDIKSMNTRYKAAGSDSPYLKLINQRERLDFKVEETYILEGDTTVGRSNKNSIVIKDPFISSEHAKFEWKEGRCRVEDMGSTNGTFVNGKKVINSGIILEDGDKVHIGQMDFLFVSSIG